MFDALVADRLSGTAQHCEAVSGEPEVISYELEDSVVLVLVLS